MSAKIDAAQRREAERAARDRVAGADVRLRAAAGSGIGGPRVVATTTRRDGGSTGPAGVPGIGTLVKTEKKPELILINRLIGSNTLGTGTTTIDVSDGYFRGGKMPITYEIVVPAVAARPGTTSADDSTFKVEPAKNTTGMFTITARASRGELAAAAYQNGETVTIKATDADKIPAADNLTFRIKANRAPVTTQAEADEDIPPLTLKVGVQNATDKSRDGIHNTNGKKLPAAQQPNPVCATFGNCMFTIALPARQVADDTVTPAVVTNIDADSRVRATYTLKDLEGATPDGITLTTLDVFGDEDLPGTILSVVEFDSKYVVVTASKNVLSLSGVKSTWGDIDPDTTGVQPGHVPQMVRLKATDAKGLSVEFDVHIQVDGPPMLTKGYEFESSYEAVQATTPTTVIDGVNEYFTDLEDLADEAGDNVTVTFTSSNLGVARPNAADADNQTGNVDAGNLIFNQLRQGTSTITVTAKDARGQTLVKTFTLVVKRA